ncbi:MAG: NAD(P)-binding domain-containing protein [Ignavibacteria bacterium]|nr:NAD(P)-binding domain-containing protein [Ignavibacteria bacterium]
MNIAIIGAGNVGGALAKAFHKAGHKIFIGSRESVSDKTKKLVEENPDFKILPINQAAAEADVILIAATPDSVRSISEALGDVSDKIIIDTMNSVFKKPEGYKNTTEALLQLTNCKDIVKCFNTTGFENMYNPVYDGNGIDMFTAGNSTKGKDIAAKLSKGIGFENCYDFGGNDKFDLIEQLAMCWINLAIMQKMGRDIAVKIIKR